jgi:hypothetical protein
MVLRVNAFDTSADELLSKFKAALRFCIADFPPALEPSYFRLVVLGWVRETEHRCDLLQYTDRPEARRLLLHNYDSYAVSERAGQCSAPREVPRSPSPGPKHNKAKQSNATKSKAKHCNAGPSNLGKPK